nr:hypothetical protein [bacterium]
MIARLTLELKNLKAAFWLPLVVLYGVLPAFVAGTFLAHDGQVLMEERLYQTMLYVQMLVPLVSAWWPIMVYRDFLDAEGNELLCVFRSTTDNLLLRALVLWGYFMAYVLVVFFIFSFLWPRVAFFYFYTAVQCLMMISLAYALAMVSGNTFLPLMACTLLSLAGFIFPEQHWLPFDYNVYLVYTPQLMKKLLILLAVSAALLGVGALFENRMKRWKTGG